MLLHATCIAIDNRAVLLTGPPGIGKSDLALRLIDDGAMLVSDDQVLLQCGDNEGAGDVLTASPPVPIAGMMEIRHIGLVKMAYAVSVPVALCIELTAADTQLERLPEPDFVFFLDRRVQRLTLPSFAASTPAKIRAALLYALLYDRVQE